jgi:hypothetical protein
MKVGSSANYHVRVRARSWDESGEQAALYDDMYTFELNQVVSVSFVPDPAVPRPWSMEGLPVDVADLTTAEQARLLELLTAPYSVTPDQARAGTEEQSAWPFDWPDASEPPRPTIFYVTPEEFARYAADLDALSEIAGNVHSVVRRADVADHDVIRFIEDRMLESTLLTLQSARAVGR